MEEILASIRRIISEDDAPGAEAKADDSQWRPPAPAAEAHEAEAAKPDIDEDILELNQPVAAESLAETHGDIDAYERDSQPEASHPEPVEAHAPVNAPEPFVSPAPERLVAPEPAERSASAFGRLAAAVTRPEPAAAPPAPGLPAPGRTLEDLTREMLAPLLKTWLDDNLPRIVQARVDEEVERIARGHVR
jgi:cell pole-organizing protein PopZ